MRLSLLLSPFISLIAVAARFNEPIESTEICDIIFKEDCPPPAPCIDIMEVDIVRQFVAQYDDSTSITTALANGCEQKFVDKNMVSASYMLGELQRELEQKGIGINLFESLSVAQAGKLYAISKDFTKKFVTNTFDVIAIKSSALPYELVQAIDYENTLAINSFMQKATELNQAFVQEILTAQQFQDNTLNEKLIAALVDEYLEFLEDVANNVLPEVGNAPHNKTLIFSESIAAHPEHNWPGVDASAQMVNVNAQKNRTKNTM